MLEYKPYFNTDIKKKNPTNHTAAVNRCDDKIHKPKLSTQNPESQTHVFSLSATEVSKSMQLSLPLFLK